MGHPGCSAFPGLGGLYSSNSAVVNRSTLQFSLKRSQDSATSTYVAGEYRTEVVKDGPPHSLHRDCSKGGKLRNGVGDFARANWLSLGENEWAICLCEKPIPRQFGDELTKLRGVEHFLVDREIAPQSGGPPSLCGSSGEPVQDNPPPAWWQCALYVAQNLPDSPGAMYGENFATQSPSDGILADHPRGSKGPVCLSAPCTTGHPSWGLERNRRCVPQVLFAPAVTISFSKDKGLAQCIAQALGLFVGLTGHPLELHSSRVLCIPRGLRPCVRFGLE